MMTSMPRSSAEEAYSIKRSGVLWAESTFVSCGTFSSARVLAACSSVSQSEEEPIMIPTRGLLAKVDSSRFSPGWRQPESGILRRFSAGGDLRALLPVVAKLSHKIQRAGDKHGVFGTGLG